MTRPSVGWVVHYVSRGSADNQFPVTCRAAIVTETDTSDAVGLAVLNPTGVFFDRTVTYNDGGGNPGNPDCPNAPHDQMPFRYCQQCDYTEPHLVGGTWHWPERVEA